MKPSKAPATQVFVARQPILDAHRKLFAYELLLGNPERVGAGDMAPDHSTARVISDAVLAIGLDTLTNGKRAFLRVGRHLLLEGVPSILPPNRVVLELGTDIEADSEILDACRALRDAGFAFAIDDFVPNAGLDDLAPMAEFLKVDFAANPTAQPPARRGGQTLIAKRIETPEGFEQAVRAGFDYFQGPFIGCPVIREGRAIPGNQITYLRLMRALHDPDLSVHKLEELIKHDAALCHRILLTVNSAAFAVRTTVHSIKQALILLGRDPVRRWVSLWMLAGLESPAGAELVSMATVRARCCEILASQTGGDDHASEGFLAGMCSLLDAILERPMPAILAELPLEPETMAALLGNDNPTRRLIDCVVAYERGEWDECTRFAGLAGIAPAALAAAYQDALQWVGAMGNEK